MAEQMEGAATALTGLASELAPVATKLAVPRSSIILLLAALNERGRLRFEPEPADVVHGPELIEAIERAGLRIVRS